MVDPALEEMSDSERAEQHGLVRVDLLGEPLAVIADIRHIIKGAEYAEVGIELATKIIAEAIPSS